MGGAFWTIFWIIVVLLWLGMMYLWFLIRHSKRTPLLDSSNGVNLLTVLGSGGHTTEMLELLLNFDEKKYTRRTYVVADSDGHSERKALESEQTRSGGVFSIEKIPRSREVGQSYVTSVFTTAHAFLISFMIVARIRPSLILVNGPGTCVPVCFSAALLDLFRITDTRIVYVESICRVEKLSLSAAILYYSGIADDVIVQWPQLKDIYSRARTLAELQTSVN